MRPLELEVIADFLEERWPSMDLTAERLAVAASRLGVRTRFRRPPLFRVLPPSAPLRALERAVGRFVQYPTELLLAPDRVGAYYHVADHSYAHLVRALPAARTGVYCHDLDAFAALGPGVQASPARKLMADWILGGLQRAAVVFHSTRAVKRQILQRGWVDEAKLVHAPYGVAPEFGVEPTQWDEHVRAAYPNNYVLHVGSSIPRKNPEGLLRCFARLRRHDPSLSLVQIGGAFTGPLLDLARELGVTEHIVQRRGLARAEIAAVYRGARLVLLPSLAEGFGLPVIEAQACGAIPLVSDLDVLREVGGRAAKFVPVQDLDAWEREGRLLLDEPGPHPSALANAASYTWEKHAEIVVSAYHELD